MSDYVPDEPYPDETRWARAATLEEVPVVDPHSPAGISSSGTCDVGGAPWNAGPQAGKGRPSRVLPRRGSSSGTQGRLEGSGAVPSPRSVSLANPKQEASP